MATVDSTRSTLRPSQYGDAGDITDQADSADDDRNPRVQEVLDLLQRVRRRTVDFRVAVDSVERADRQRVMRLLLVVMSVQADSHLVDLQVAAGRVRRGGHAVVDAGSRHRVMEVVVDRMTVGRRRVVVVMDADARLDVGQQELDGVESGRCRPARQRSRRRVHRDRTRRAVYEQQL